MATQDQDQDLQQQQPPQEQQPQPTSEPEHNYGSKCRLAPVPIPSVAGQEEDLPLMRAQFFYSSAIPIDDFLSSGAIAGAPDSKSFKGNLRPFSPGDNNALEKAWLGLISLPDLQTHRRVLRNRGPDAPTAAMTSEKLGRLVRYLGSKHREKHRSFVPQDLTSPVTPADQPLDTPAPTCCDELYLDVAAELEKAFCSLLREHDPSISTENVVAEVMMDLRRQRASTSKRRSTADLRPLSRPSPRLQPLQPANDEIAAEPRRGTEPVIPACESTDADIARGKLRAVEIKRPRPRSTSQATASSFAALTPTNASIPARPPTLDDGISGKPFVRVGSSSMDRGTSPAQSQMPMGRLDESRARDPLSRDPPARDPPARDPSARDPPARDPAGEGSEELDHEDSIVGYTDAPEDESRPSEAASRDPEYTTDSAEVAVGLSRLHMVSLPVLQMRPIYWSPINDLAVVSRATWFYRDTMLPIPAQVANQLEAGYQELRPYSEPWSDELKCAIEVGPLGEEKVAHRLWPRDPDRADASFSLHAISDDQYCAAHCFRGEAAADGSVEPLQPADLNGTAAGRQSTAPSRPFANYQVIYKNATDAFLLKPNLKPSAYYGRRPVYRIMKGLTVGVPVVRGFNRAVWDRLYDKKTAAAKAKAQAQTQTQTQAGDPAAAPGITSQRAGSGACAACRAAKNRGQVTDLVLVAHGIGQKLAERVESFHFTHAINTFRRSINLELAKPAVREVLREGQNGIMVLPVNWRHSLSFEDGGPMREEDKTSRGPDGFGLKDIEPTTIPAVRSMISDVMFDIPYYLSHHKGKMIQALVSEANRVYRLWCRNNPGFAQNGRVHLIAHSLGSAMALEILSRQPTEPLQIDFSVRTSNTHHFEFDTKNLFFAGSPAGFFLLLERGALIPRRGRQKPGVDRHDVVSDDVVGDAGSFGCLAVDNIYNVLAKEDPIAYLLNGTIDPAYAASLQTAYVPSTAVSLLRYVGNAVRGLVVSAPPAAASAAPSSVPEGGGLADMALPATTARLPSQLELEVHDFSREDVAEKKAYLLNDNGQIDYFLRSGGGPLEIQYLNMLSAHTSYWTNNDFIRMLCTEIGRKPGREHTLPAMRVVKAAKRMIPGAGAGAGPGAEAGTGTGTGS